MSLQPQAAPDQQLTLLQVMEMAHANAVKKGIWDHANAKSDIESMALVLTEVAECIEVMRLRGYEPTAVWYEGSVATPPDQLRKPEGLPIELADIIIRVCDFAKARGIDLNRAVLAKMRYNESRPQMHGKVIT